jgi:hypothetical protein
MAWIAQRERSLGLHPGNGHAIECAQFLILEATMSTTARFPGSTRDI